MISKTLWRLCCQSEVHPAFLFSCKCRLIAGGKGKNTSCISARHFYPEGEGPRNLYLCFSHSVRSFGHFPALAIETRIRSKITHNTYPRDRATLLTLKDKKFEQITQQPLLSYFMEQKGRSSPKFSKYTADGKSCPEPRCSYI